MNSQVAVLYARPDSIYKLLDGADVWDMERDARRWPGGAPVVAHPPCRAWGRLRAFAKPREDEKALALHAVESVRRWGGVLEHPAGSTLWTAAGLPRPFEGPDDWGGWTLPVSQFWWGHKAEKRTWLYIVGAAPDELPPIPFRMGYPTHIIGSSMRRKGERGWMPGTTKAEREHTPPALAVWLVAVARVCARAGHMQKPPDEFAARTVQQPRGLLHSPAAFIEGGAQLERFTPWQK
ncbi:MAG TPA: hypothetical protein PKD87_14270 [Burkholderiaceae bacterium]|nr:hypothetical protein [Burkholderiaceae bacterium]